MTDVARLGELSKLLFGSSYRLRVAAAIAAGREEGIYVRALAEQLGVAHNLVSTEVRRFRDAGILEEMRAEGSGPRRTVYRRAPSPFWTAALELAQSPTVGAPSILERLRAGESESFEVKGSLEPSMHSPQPLDAILRTTVGFLNGTGGTMLIGAAEQSEASNLDPAASRIGAWSVIGLRARTFLEEGWDAWVREMFDAVFTRVVPAPVHLVAIKPLQLVGRDLATITVQSSSEMFFLKDQHGVPRYMVREAGRTVELAGPAMARHWEQRTHLERARFTVGITGGADVATVTYRDDEGVHTRTVPSEVARQLVDERNRKTD